MAAVILVNLEREKETRGLPPPNGILCVVDAVEKGGFRAKLFHERAAAETIFD